MHFFSSFDPSALGHHPTYEGHSEGYVHESLVAREEGSVHTGLSVNELAPGGRIDPHVHSFEESFYVLSGEARHDQRFGLSPHGRRLRGGQSRDAACLANRWNDPGALASDGGSAA